MGRAVEAYAKIGSEIAFIRAHKTTGMGSDLSGISPTTPGARVEATVAKVMKVLGEPGQLHPPRLVRILASTDSSTPPGFDLVLGGRFDNYIEPNPKGRTNAELVAAGKQVVIERDEKTGNVVGVAVRDRRRPGDPFVKDNDGSQTHTVFTWRGKRFV